MWIHLLTLGLIDGAGSEEQPPATEQRNGGFVITDVAPKLWWQRRPKNLSEEQAQQKLTKAARLIERIAKQQLVKDLSAKQKKKEARQALSPVLAEMPGFDWVTLYKAIWDDLQRKEAAKNQQKVASFIADDEETLLLLLAS